MEKETEDLDELMLLVLLESPTEGPLRQLLILCCEELLILIDVSLFLVGSTCFLCDTIPADRASSRVNKASKKNGTSKLGPAKGECGCAVLA